MNCRMVGLVMTRCHNNIVRYKNKIYLQPAVWQLVKLWVTVHILKDDKNTIDKIQLFTENLNWLNDVFRIILIIRTILPLTCQSVPLNLRLLNISVHCLMLRVELLTRPGCRAKYYWTSGQTAILSLISLAQSAPSGPLTPRWQQPQNGDTGQYINNERAHARIPGFLSVSDW